MIAQGKMREALRIDVRGHDTLMHWPETPPISG